ncbi:MAG: hypothetical protein KKF50_01545 [Nanoarchaeota archaeon]|nr:hypothetical protein [Nanoarchaeota archaeon]
MERHYKSQNNMPPGPGSGIANYTPLKEQEISHQPGWFDLPKNGGGDIDLADY